MHLSYHCGCFSLSETAASGHQTEPDTAPGHWLKQSQLRSLCWVRVSLYSHFPLYLMAHWAGVFSLHSLTFSILTSCVSHPEPIIRLRTWPQPQSPQPGTFHPLGPWGLSLSFLLAMPLLFLFSSPAFFWVIFIILLFLLLIWSHIFPLFSWLPSKLQHESISYPCSMLVNTTPFSVIWGLRTQPCWPPGIICCCVF